MGSIIGISGFNKTGFSNTEISSERLINAGFNKTGVDRSTNTQLFSITSDNNLPDRQLNQPIPPLINSTIKTQQNSDINLDLNEALEAEKSLSIVYQLMLAIARQNKEVDVSSTQNTITGLFAVEVEYKAEFDLEQTVNVKNQITDLNQNSIIAVSSNSQSFLSVSLDSTEPVLSDPLILNLDNSDFSFEPDQRVRFDLNADGNLDTFSNLTANNVFLALDKNNNGFIDDGSEFFGDSRGADNGFVDLARYDLNHDNQIDANDQIFKSLLLVRFNPEGEQMLSTLTSQNIISLSLNQQAEIKQYSDNNLLISYSDFKRNDGSSGVIGDFLLSIM